MNKMKVVITAMLVAVMAFSSCNKDKSAAKELVNEFLKENLVSEDYKVLYCYDLSTTKFVTDSMCQEMRAKMASNKRFKSNMHCRGSRVEEFAFHPCEIPRRQGYCLSNLLSRRAANTRGGIQGELRE